MLERWNDFECNVDSRVEVAPICVGVSVYVPDTDIVPDETQNVLIQLRDTHRYSAFMIGDIANDLILRAAKKGFPVTNARIFEAIGHFCDRSGRTVRYYAETASFFPQDVRDQYDVLPFSCFVFARQMGTRWPEVMEYSLTKPNIGIRELRLKFLSEKNVCVVEDEEECVHDTSVDGVLPERMKPAGSEPKAHVFQSVIITLNRLAVEADKLIEDEMIKERIRKELSENISNIRRLTCEIANES
jgi:hypothetical protein